MAQNINQNYSKRTSSYQHNHYTMILPVFNEESRIKRVIDYYKQFARLIVIDNYSTDKTLHILKELNVEGVKHKNPGSTQTPECLNFFNSLTTTDYILLLSCSEFIPIALLNLFEKIAIERKHDIVSCVRDSYTCGELIPLWGGRFKCIEARVERFYNKHGIDINKVIIHNHYIPFDKKKILYLPRDMRYVIAHLRDSDAKLLIKKSVDYAAVEAQHRAKQGSTIKCVQLSFLIGKEIIRFLHLPLSKWNMIALREIWARMIMHSITFWIGWEIRKQKNIEYSWKQNERLWDKLIKNNN